MPGRGSNLPEACAIPRSGVSFFARSNLLLGLDYEQPVFVPQSRHV
jgi:hypothetical protein